MDHFSEFTGEVFNVVGDNASILDLVGAVQSFLPEVGVRYTEQDVLTHLSIKVSNQKILERGWQPQCPLEEGLEELTKKFAGLMAR